jgi:hypothetical protein
MAASMCFAQGGGGGGGGRGQGRRGGNPNALTSLIGRHDVQMDLALTDEEKGKLDDLRQSWRPQQGAARPTPEEMQTRQVERDKAVEGILTADQDRRLHEIQIQVAGDSAVLFPDVQTKLNLTDDQKSQIKDLQKQQADANASIREKQEAPQDARADYQKNTDTMKANLHKVLTPAQLDQLKALGGSKPFVAEPPPGSAK